MFREKNRRLRPKWLSDGRRSWPDGSASAAHTFQCCFCLMSDCRVLFSMFEYATQAGIGDWTQMQYGAVLQTHQKAVVSAQHAVAEGWTRAVVAGHEASVQTPGASCHLGRIQAKHLNFCCVYFRRLWFLSKPAKRTGGGDPLGQIPQLLVWNQTDGASQTHVTAALHNRRITSCQKSHPQTWSSVSASKAGLRWEWWFQWPVCDQRSRLREASPVI